MVVEVCVVDWLGLLYVFGCVFVMVDVDVWLVYVVMYVG